MNGNLLFKARASPPSKQCTEDLTTRIGTLSVRPSSSCPATSAALFSAMTRSLLAFSRLYR